MKNWKQEMIRTTAPTLWRNFQMLDRAMEKAKEEFKEKYGLLWKLKVSKEQLGKRQIEIATGWTLERYEKLAQEMEI